MFNVVLVATDVIIGAGLCTHYDYEAKGSQTISKGVTSPDTLMSRSCYLLQCLASINWDGDYGRT
eukprot:3942493-Pleurochrysis_carterae.AAC.1